MSNTLKKTFRILSYGLILTVGAVVAIIPFIKKNPEFSTTYIPSAPDAQADATPYWEPARGDDDDDGGY